MAHNQKERQVVRCASCEKKLKVPAAAAGRRVKCPGCGAVVAVPRETAKAKAELLAPTDGDSLRVTCEGCGSKMKVPAKAAGRRVKCPKCAAVLTVPAPQRAPADGSDDDAGFSEDDGLLDDLVAAERSAEALARPDLAATAPPQRGTGFAQPGPSSRVANGGITAGTVASAASATLGGLGRSVGSFVLGCVLSTIAAVIGAVVWTVVAVVTEYQFGLIAWGVGGLTGFGMALGFRRVSALGGLVAASLSLVSILVAKFTIFMIVLSAIVMAATGEVPIVEETQVQSDDPEQGAVTVQREVIVDEFYIARQMTEDILDEWNVWAPAERQREWSTAWGEAVYRLKHMSDEEVLAAWNKYRAEDEDLAESGGEDPSEEETAFDDGGKGMDIDNGGNDAELDEEPASAEPADREWERDEAYEEYDEDSSEASAGAFLGMFVRTVFRPLDLLFILLAIATAFRVGSQGLQGV